MHRTLLHRNFLRVIHSQVNLLLQLLHECITENCGLEPQFYQRLSEAWTILMDFFHADGKGISMESFETILFHKVKFFVKFIFFNITFVTISFNKIEIMR